MQGTDKEINNKNYWRLDNLDFQNIDLLCIGHCCHDKVENEYILGGTTSYAAVAAKRLGKNSAILSSVGRDFEFFSYFENLEIPFHNVPGQHTTVFENIYADDVRTQYIHRRANTITPNDLPPDYADVPMVLLGSIAREIDFAIMDRFDNALIGAVIQGTMRKWDDDGLVSSNVMEWAVLNGVDIIFISDDDMRGYEKYMPQLIQCASQVVLTKGAKGATIFCDGKEMSFPSFPTELVDATGAGDVFTTAYMIRYNETRDIEASCIFAHCAASFAIEGEGMSNLSSLEEIEDRVLRYNSIIT